jgi:hypothetical protein
MKLYHGTSESAFKAMLDAGAILPRNALKAKKRGNWKHSVLSNPFCVYLTNTYGFYFAMNAVRMPERDSTDYEKAVILEIDTHRLDWNQMTADEDAVEQATRTGSVGTKEMERRTKAWRGKITSLGGTDMANLSLEAMGTCAHIGPVPLEAVTRVAMIDILAAREAAWLAIDAQPAVRSFRLAGAMHHRLNRWVFGDEGKCDMFPPECLDWEPVTVGGRTFGGLPESRDGIDILAMEQFLAVVGGVG